MEVSFITQAFLYLVSFIWNYYLKSMIGNRILWSFFLQKKCYQTTFLTMIWNAFDFMWEMLIIHKGLWLFPQTSVYQDQIWGYFLLCIHRGALNLSGRINCVSDHLFFSVFPLNSCPCLPVPPGDHPRDSSSFPCKSTSLC